MFRDGYSNEKNTNKRQFLLIDNYLIYNIIWLGKLNIFLLKQNLDYIYTMSFFI